MATSRTVLDTKNISDESIASIDIASLSAAKLSVNTLSAIKIGETNLHQTLAEISSQSSGAGYTQGDVIDGTLNLYGKDGSVELTVDVSPDTLGVVALGEQRIPTEVAAQVLNNLGLTGNGYMIINPKYGFRVDGNGKLIADTLGGDLTLSGYQDIDNYLFTSKYESDPNVQNVDASQLTSLTGKRAMNRAFYGCNNLKTANLSCLKSIRGEGAMAEAFSNSGLNSINMSELTAIDAMSAVASALYFAPLSSVEFPKLKYINGDYAARDMVHRCNAISITFPELTSVDGRQAVRGMIYDNPKLQRIDFPRLEKIDARSMMYMAANNPQLTSICLSALTSIYNIPGNDVDTGYMSTGNANLMNVDFSNLQEVQNYGLKYAFQNDKKLQNASFPKLTIAKSYAFHQAYNGSGISSVSFPKLSSIDTYTFGYAFGSTTDLQNAEFPELTAIPYNGFLYGFSNSKIKYAHFPNCVTVGQSGLQSVFQNASELISVDFSSISSLNSNYGMMYAFDGCTKLQTVKFGEFSININDQFSYAFRNCTSLSSIDLPITYITGGLEQYMFGGCNNLTSITFSKLEHISYKGIQYAFNACSKLQTVDFPELTSIYQEDAFYHTFDGCASLRNINFPKLQFIGNSNTTDNYQYRQFGYAFETCAPNIILRFPSLTQIKQTYNSSNNATFFNCTKVKAMYFKKLSSIVGQTNQLTDAGAKYIFNNCTTLTDLYFNVAVKDYIESHPGYPTLWGLGAGRATVHFLEENDPAWEA